jgi:hypothetical protein
MRRDKAEATPVQQMRRNRGSSTRWLRRKQRRGFDSSWSANSMASRVSFQGLTTSSAQRGAAEATDSDAATSLARRVRRRGCPSEPIWLCRFVPGIHDIQQLLFLVDRRARPQLTVGIILSAIFHPRQPFPANFFVTHGTSSPSSISYHRSCSPREFTFHLFFSFTTKATPRFALIR